jgi:hypothetical protein
MKSPSPSPSSDQLSEEIDSAREFLDHVANYHIDIEKAHMGEDELKNEFIRMLSDGELDHRDPRILELASVLNDITKCDHIRWYS